MLMAWAFKSFDNCKHAIGFVQGLWFAQSFMGLLFRFSQPGFELFDTSFVLCPKFDIFREVVALLHHLLVQVSDIVLDPLQLIFVVLSILRYLKMDAFKLCFIDKISKSKFQKGMGQ